MGDQLGLKSILDCRDALALALGAGGDAGALHLRGALLHSCMAPAEGTPCQLCTRAQCKGNKLEKDSDGAYTLIFSHHKNSHRGLPGFSVAISKDSLSHKLLDIWLEHARLALL